MSQNTTCFGAATCGTTPGRADSMTPEARRASPRPPPSSVSPCLQCALHNLSLTLLYLPVHSILSRAQPLATKHLEPRSLLRRTALDAYLDGEIGLWPFPVVEPTLDGYTKSAPLFRAAQWGDLELLEETLDGYVELGLARASHAQSKRVWKSVL